MRLCRFAHRVNGEGHTLFSGSLRLAATAARPRRRLGLARQCAFKKTTRASTSCCTNTCTIATRTCPGSRPTRSCAGETISFETSPEVTRHARAQRLIKTLATCQSRLRMFASVAIGRDWWMQERADCLSSFATNREYIQLRLHMRDPRELHVNGCAKSCHLECLLVETVAQLAQFVQNGGCKRLGHVSPERFPRCSPRIGKSMGKRSADYGSAPLTAVPFCTEVLPRFASGKNDSVAWGRTRGQRDRRCG